VLIDMAKYTPLHHPQQINAHYFMACSFLKHFSADIQAAYNNTTEIELELENSGTRTVQGPSSSLFPIGTKVARQFDDDDNDLICHRLT
jgi:outer membrane lipopolysaccharide assembly protein LptE/RlpB